MRPLLVMTAGVPLSDKRTQRGSLCAAADAVGADALVVFVRTDPVVLGEP